MKKSRNTEEQIAFALKQAELGTAVAGVCRKMGISEATFCNWKKKYGGLGVSELRRLKPLEEENARLRQMVADSILDKQMLQDKGRECISHPLDHWAYENGVTLDFSRPGKPADNPFIASFNGRFRNECLNEN